MEDNYRDEDMGFRGLTKLRLHHINDPSPHRGLYIFLGTPLNFHCNPNFQARVYTSVYIYPVSVTKDKIIHLFVWLHLFSCLESSGLRRSK
jgi:hypothetical protein